MQILTQNRLLEKIFWERALCFHEKLILLPSIPFWRNYEVHNPRLLKNQRVFIQEVLKLRKELNIPDCVENMLPPKKPVKDFSFNRRLEMSTHVEKCMTSDEKLKAIALETIQTKFPSPEWQNIHTDGSRLSVESNARAGVYSDLFSFYATLGPNSTHFDGEIEATKISLGYLVDRCNQYEKVVISSDSTSAIQAITRYGTPESKAFEGCRNYLNTLMTRGVKTVALVTTMH